MKAFPCHVNCTLQLKVSVLVVDGLTEDVYIFTALKKFWHFFLDLEHFCLPPFNNFSLTFAMSLQYLVNTLLILVAVTLKNILI